MRMITHMKKRLRRYMGRAMQRKILLALSIMGIGLYAIAPAQGEETKKAGKVIKGISGEVSAISKDFIAIVYRRDAARGSEEEIALPIAKGVIVEHKKNLSEIAIGDMVDVEFAEITEETKEGPKSKRIARVISFVRAAPAPKPESSVLVSGREQEEEEE
jgi:hypothetical protein